jgi:hypothetical protein
MQKKIKSSIFPSLVFGIFIILLFISPDHTGVWTYPDVVMSVPNVLLGKALVTEIAQDIYGFRALFFDLDPYAILHDAVPLIGAEWQDQSPTTHPPTAFLFVAPVAFLPVKVAFAVWAWLMVAAIIVSLRAYDFSWQASIVLGLLSMLWPPTITSLGNLPCVWMLGLALAYRQRNRNPLIAGVWIGIASFTKLLPVVLLFPFLIKKKWSALIGFLFAWGVALFLLYLISPSVIFQYLKVMKSISPFWITWVGNGSPLIFLFRYFDLPGLGVGLYVLLLMVTLNWRKWFNQESDISPEAWHLFSFFSVILLPIAWAYSISPLLPNLLVLARSTGLKRVLGLLALSGPVIAVMVGLPSAGVILMLVIPYCFSWIFTLDRPIFSSWRRVYSPTH